MRAIAIFSALLLSANPAHAVESARQMAGRHLCLGCHAVDEVRVGPAFQDIPKRYRSHQQAIDELVRSIRDGSVGKWGSTPMPPETAPADELAQVVEWIMQQ